jgi:membrane-bound metal-dependent hydrolase YbcI (DUF457 family)
MALAVTHVLITIVVLDLLRHYLFGLKKFPRYLVVIGGIAGLGPDIDIPLSWISGMNLHGVFTHSLFFVILFLAIGAVRKYQNDTTGAKIFYVIAFGWFMHLILDCAFGGYGTFLWPMPINTAGFCPKWAIESFRTSIDAILLVLWISHEEIHNKIRDYI